MSSILALWIWRFSSMRCVITLSSLINSSKYPFWILRWRWGVGEGVSGCGSGDGTSTSPGWPTDRGRNRQGSLRRTLVLAPVHSELKRASGKTREKDADTASAMFRGHSVCPQLPWRPPFLLLHVLRTVKPLALQESKEERKTSRLWSFGEGKGGRPCPLSCSLSSSVQTAEADAGLPGTNGNTVGSAQCDFKLGILIQKHQCHLSENNPRYFYYLWEGTGEVMIKFSSKDRGVTHIIDWRDNKKKWYRRHIIE